MKIIFFNHFHNGDVHLARGFIQQIMEKCPGHQYFYAHRNQTNLVPECPMAEMPSCNEHTVSHRENGAIYLNTWYGQYNSTFISQYGLTFDCLYAIFDRHCKEVFNKSLADIQPDLTLLFPHLNPEFYYTQKMQDWLCYQWQHKTVMFENGQALSGQAENFDMNKVALDLASEKPDMRFIVSQKIESAPSNVYYTGDIIQKESGSDLNEIGILASRSRLFVGRTSGVTSFCMNKHILFNSQLRMMLFCYDTAQPYWLKSTNRVKYAAHITVHGETNVETVKNLIRKEI